MKKVLLVIVVIILSVSLISYFVKEEKINEKQNEITENQKIKKQQSTLSKSSHQNLTPLTIESSNFNKTPLSRNKKPEKNTMEMVDYLKEKAQKDIRLNDNNTLHNSLDYIKNNLDTCDNTNLENLIYYGYILEFSPKESSEGLYTTIGIKTIDLAKEVYIKDNKYQKSRSNFNKTKAQIIKALISRVDK